MPLLSEITFLQSSLRSAFLSLRHAVMLITSGIKALQRRNTSGVHACLSAAVPCAARAGDATSRNGAIKSLDHGPRRVIVSLRNTGLFLGAMQVRSLTFGHGGRRT